MNTKHKLTHLMIFLLLILLTLAGCTQLLGEGYTPAEFAVDGERAVMSGVIDRTTPKVVQALLDEHPNVTTIVMQNVGGSVDDEANLVAARLVRAAGLHTHVPADGEIASGGVDFFLAGVERTVEEGARLGVHSWGGEPGQDGDSVPKDDPQHNLYLDYYAEMGTPAEFYWYTLEAAPASSIHWMSSAEITQYQMTTK